MNKIIRFENVGFSYDKSVEFIENLNFSVEKGSYTCVIGANGCGKTTVARLMSGLVYSDKGDVFINGMVINNQHINDIRKYIGVIFQNPDNQYVASTLKEDIVFGLENHNVEADRMDEIIEMVSKECFIQELIEKDPSSLSGGQKQKGAIAGMLAINPKILILDEATSMLDPASRKELLELVLNLKENKDMTIISITHDINEVLLADQIILLDEGKIVFDGNKQDFYKRDFSSYNITLPFIMQLEKKLGYDDFISYHDFIKSVGEKQ